MKILLFATLALGLPALASAQAPQAQRTYSVPLIDTSASYDFRFSPRPAVRCPEWLSRAILLELKEAPSPEAIEEILRQAGVSASVEAISRSAQPGGYVAARKGRGIPMALYGRRASLPGRMMSVEEALQEIARQAQVDIEFYALAGGAWRVVVREALSVSGGNLYMYMAGPPQQTVVSGDVARALLQANTEANAMQSRGNTRSGAPGGVGRGGFGGGAAPTSDAMTNLQIVQQSVARLPAPGISEKLVSLDLRRRSLKECFDVLLKQSRLDYVLEGNFPLGPPRTFAFEGLPLDLALDVLCASGTVGWSAELREGRPFIKVGTRYALPRP